MVVPTFSGPGQTVLVIFSGSALLFVSKKGEILLWPRARSRFVVPEAQFSKFCKVEATGK